MLFTRRAKAMTRKKLDEFVSRKMIHPALFDTPLDSFIAEHVECGHDLPVPAT
jgi:hypothetical protein